MYNYTIKYIVVLNHVCHNKIYNVKEILIIAVALHIVTKIYI